jgi:hypothetical protein
MKQKAHGLGIEMRTFTGKSGTKYLTFKTQRGSYHTFSRSHCSRRCCRLRIGSGHHESGLAKLSRLGRPEAAAVGPVADMARTFAPGAVCVRPPHPLKIAKNADLGGRAAARSVLPHIPKAASGS